jgi:hypothetical protein
VKFTPLAHSATITGSIMVDLISILDGLSAQSKLKNILWRKSVTQRIDEVYQQLSTAMQLFDVSVSLDL